MLQLLWLIPTLPFLGFLLIVFNCGRWSKPIASILGVGSVGVAFLLNLLIAISFIASPPEGNVFVQTCWQWIQIGDFSPAFAFHLDALSLVMMLVITGVGFLIHLYSIEFMEDDESFAKFFSYMNLFVASMLVLVLADNLLLLYLGWEGVGLCSYLLIGFWYKDEANVKAANKAFIVTRIGDTGMAIGLFLLFAQLGTLHIGDLMQAAQTAWPEGSTIASLAALLLLIGAIGKSAQLPLHTWLPDAMAGPTPVSALIHAATMVTAGVYLIARTHVLFELSPVIMALTGTIGALTLLIAGFTALTQRDIKKVLAYSTISQLGYMFVALGVGAWPMAMFHFMTHAFFKAQLFLGAGAISHCLHHTYDMDKMGGLRTRLPGVFWTFMAGASALAALPLVTAGFYSKDAILWKAFIAGGGNILFWIAGLAGAFITALYTFRMIFLTFFGAAKTEPDKKPRAPIMIALTVLAFLSIVGGFVETPYTLGGFHAFSDFLSPVFAYGEGAAYGEHPPILLEAIVQLIAVAITLAGVWLAWFLYLRTPSEPKPVQTNSPIWEFWKQGWGFDAFYDRTFIQPYTLLASWNRNDFIDSIPNGLAWINRALHSLLSSTQTGQLRWYASGIALGTVILIAIVVWL